MNLSTCTNTSSSTIQQKAAYEQLREMLMNMTNSGTCAPNLFWPYNHQPPPGSPPPPPALSLY
jgi:hypothetical protein